MIRDWISRRLFSLGQRAAPGLSPAAVRALGAAAYALAKLDRTHLATYAANLRRVLGHEPSPELLRAGLASWIRMNVEVLALPSWSRDTVLDKVATVGERHLREAWASGRGVVVALPHLGNWDLAGAWACLAGYPVTTVAENLGEREFAAYTALRGRLGMEVLAHDAPDVVGALLTAVRRGRLVCLLSDRDLPLRGVPVSFAGQPVSMPAGPALIARRTGAVLIGAAGRYRPDGMVLEISPPVPARPGREGLVAMTQDLADFFTVQVRAAPADWHMLQPFFDLRPGLGGPTMPDRSLGE
ncbi:MAG: phosphatidylinositol mannoside acyltransferase [Propionibacteriaceae bacterium]|nr:phosphatidylinositol mannoside acyltransferase [Propionibacteriaceae bacterium]